MKEERCPAGSVSPSWLPSENGVCADMKDIYPSIVSYQTLEKTANRKVLLIDCLIPFSTSFPLSNCSKCTYPCLPGVPCVMGDHSFKHGCFPI